MKKNEVLLIFCILMFGCNDSNNKIEKITVDYRNTVELELRRDIIFYNSDTMTIGFIHDFEIFNNRFYLTDYTDCKIHVFDTNMTHIKNSLGKGFGPGEFPSPPFLTKGPNSLFVYSVGKIGLQLVDSNFNTINTIESKSGFIENFAMDPLITENYIVANMYSIYPAVGINKGDISTAAILDISGKLKKAICFFDKEYEENSEFAYFAEHIEVFISNCFNNTALIFQSATTNFHQYNYEGDYLKTFNYVPRFYKVPAGISSSQIGQYNSLEEYYDKYCTKVTTFRKISFDQKNDLVLINYCTVKKERIYSKSWLDAENYLCIINSNYECIFDGIINGYLLGVNNRRIYVLVEESEEKIVINEYIIKRKQ
ncbi:MAG: hypothetical protein GXX85_07590 [Ignavibacteria bacterium]|nr:hypothetical protein [Ignavibacteria bacterium]